MNDKSSRLESSTTESAEAPRSLEESTDAYGARATEKISLEMLRKVRDLADDSAVPFDEKTQNIDLSQLAAIVVEDEALYAEVFDEPTPRPTPLPQPTMPPAELAARLRRRYRVEKAQADPAEEAVDIDPTSVAKVAPPATDHEESSASIHSLEPSAALDEIRVSTDRWTVALAGIGVASIAVGAISDVSIALVTGTLALIVAGLIALYRHEPDRLGGKDGE